MHSNYVGMREGYFKIYRPSEKIQNLIFNNVLKRINSYMVLFLHVRFDLSNCVEGGYISILSVLVFFCCSTVSVHISVTINNGVFFYNVDVFIRLWLLSVLSIYNVMFVPRGGGIRSAIKLNTTITWCSYYKKMLHCANIYL